MGARLLLVEDDSGLRQALSLSLQDQGHVVLEVGTGEAAVLALADAPDLVLLDLGLPDVDGVEVCRRLRARSDLPIIMVTARSHSAAVVDGLQAGTDDYISKPLVAAELSARIEALLRRVQPRGGTTRLGSIELHADQGSVRRDGRELHLTKTEFRLLCELAARPGEVVTRQELLERVWGYDYFGDTRLLDVHIRRLRVKVEDDPGEPRLVLTVRGTGYRIQT